MKTWSGRNAPLPEPYVQDSDPVSPVDIAVHLGRTGRFGGWGTKEWTVLHHSVLATTLWLKFYGAAGAHHALLHDFHEYVTGDIPSPIKQVTNGAIKPLEQHLDQVIYKALGVQQPEEVEHRRVKVVDFSCLLIEAEYFGTPGTTGRIFQVDWKNLPADFQKDVEACINASFPGLFGSWKWLINPEEAP
jgi:hypothetical protein